MPLTTETYHLYIYAYLYKNKNTSQPEKKLERLFEVIGNYRYYHVSIKSLIKDLLEDDGLNVAYTKLV